MPSFEWDDQKESLNILKHGVSFAEAQRVFADPSYLVYRDDDHSGVEERYYAIGRVEAGIVTVRFTYRRGKIRIFGAGLWRDGRRLYEKENRL